MTFPVGTGSEVDACVVDDTVLGAGRVVVVGGGSLEGGAGQS